MAAPSAATTLILEKLAALEEGQRSLVPLLEKIVTHMETQVPAPAPQIASYEALYTLPAPGPPEGELVEAARQADVARPAWWQRLLCGAPR